MTDFRAANLGPADNPYGATFVYVPFASEGRICWARWNGERYDKLIRGAKTTDPFPHTFPGDCESVEI